MRLLLVSPFSPWPPTFGGAQRTLAIARALSVRHHVTLSCPLPTPPPGGDSGVLRQEIEAGLSGVASDIIWAPEGRAPVPGGSPAPPARLPRRAVRRIVDLVANPVPFEFRTVDPAWTTLVTRMRDRFDAALVRYPNFLPVVSSFEHGRVIVDIDDINWLCLARLAATEDGWARRIGLRLDAARSWRFEQRLYGKLAQALVCSAEDRRRLRSHRVTVLPNGIDLHESGPATRTADRLLFVGHCGWRPNVSGLRWFLNEVWPGVLAARPGASFCIVGREASATSLGVGPRPGVQYAADVPEVASWFASATASVVPLWEGGGTRIKILESLGQGTPVVSTPMGAAGLHPDFGEAEGLYLAGDAEGTVGQIIRLMSNPGSAGAAAATGRERVRREYLWSAITRRLPEELEAWVTGRETRPPPSARPQGNQSDR